MSRKGKFSIGELTLGGSSTRQGNLIRDYENNILLCRGTINPETINVRGYAPGCLYIGIDINGNGAVYENIGSKIMSNFKRIDPGVIGEIPIGGYFSK